MTERLYLGVDVGTGSTRAGVFDAEGRMRGMGTHPISLWRPEEDFAEHSSEDIWRACGEAIRRALAQEKLAPESIVGIGFDATCSLVAVDDHDLPVTVSPTGANAQNVIVWMDHRAIAQAARINETHHDVLKYVGGTISPEMQTPKLLWLKERLPSTWTRAARFFDLPDFLTWRATGVDVRSLCTTVCKWTYLGHESRGWDESYFRAIGLGDLADEGFRRIGTRVRPMGEKVGTLTEKSARDLGLSPGVAVGVSIIDAHAGGIGMIGARLPFESTFEAPSDDSEPTDEVLETRLALIGGTSTCHMAVSRAPKFVRGVWGPYFSAMIPGLWLTEGGQSATGALIDHTVHSHARGSELREDARRGGTTVYALLNDRLAAIAAEAKAPFVGALTGDLHVLPDHHGNRSPRADPTLRGMVSGLRLTDSIDSLALVYLATIQAIAHGTRHILAAMNADGHRVATLLACGGDTKNPLFVREHADATGCRVVLSREPEAVLLGAAILGAVASGDHTSVQSAMARMNRAAEVIEPNGGEVAAFHARKHRVFLRMHDDQLAYRGLMER